MTEPEEAPWVLARIIARACLNENQGGHATVGRTRKRVKKDESLHVEPHEVNLMEEPASNLTDRLLVRLVFSDKLGQS